MTTLPTRVELYSVRNPGNYSKMVLGKGVDPAERFTGI